MGARSTIQVSPRFVLGQAVKPQQIDSISMDRANGDQEVADPNAVRYEEFLRYFARDRDRLYSYIFSLLPHHADAEDVFQRCSLILWRKFVHFDAERGFLPWACGIALFEVRNFLRVAGRDRLRLDLELVGQIADRRAEWVEQEEDRLAALRGCVAKLKRPEQDLIQQIYCGDHTIKDLAEEAGQPTQTLYNRLSLIRRKLFDCVQRSLATQG